MYILNIKFINIIINKLLKYQNFYFSLIRINYKLVIDHYKILKNFL